ncbi:MAG: hypothetical protein J0H98_05935 [Solirubrobacterales bacterium]|nr:hypothetical protein [Solirubrobacterales bacterium]
MKVALAQLNPASDVARDSDTAGAVIDSLPGTDLILFPELFLGGYDTEDPGSHAARPDGPELATVGAACARAGAAAVIGFTEPLGEGRFANSAACFERDGSLAGVYRKTHLFGAAERATFAAGDSMNVVRLADHRVGPQICFDVEFPEPSRLMAVSGADLLATISANMTPYAADHRLAARARALDNRLHHLYVNRIGHESGFDFVGESCVIDPTGTVVAELGTDEGILEHELEDVSVGVDSAYLDHIHPRLNVIVQDNANGGEV